LEVLLEQERRETGLNLARMNPYLAMSALYRFVRYRALAAFKDKDRRAELPKDTVEQYLRELSRLARENRFKVLVAVFPYFESLEDYPLGQHHEVMRALAAAQRFHHLDLLPAFRRCAAESPERVGFDPLHPTPSGHLCAASAMADYILASVVR
ncbi:MAG: SGNH/GDSL hydrolase family protein, partial [Acidobacteria bacterium]|nr:SGNH/GDSL hydrolase family protein [Acidobacteriota bacterium]